MWFESENATILKAQQGHRQAMDKLLNKYRKDVFHYVLRITGNWQDAEDVTQDTFVAMMTTVASYRGECPFKHWLLRIAHFRSMDVFRKRKAHESWQEQLDERSVDCPAEAWFSLQQQQREVIYSMQRLPVEQRLVIELKFFQQMTFLQIAEQLMESESTIKSRFYAAIKTMKPQLEAQYG